MGSITLLWSEFWVGFLTKILKRTVVMHTHTDAILELQDEIAGGVLNGKFDSDWIVCTGL